MGYESVEHESLITLKTVLESYIRTVAIRGSQTRKDAEYELGRINEELER